MRRSEQKLAEIFQFKFPADKTWIANLFPQLLFAESAYFNSHIQAEYWPLESDHTLLMLSYEQALETLGGKPRPPWIVVYIFCRFFVDIFL